MNGSVQIKVHETDEDLWQLLNTVFESETRENVEWLKLTTEEAEVTFFRAKVEDEQ